MTDVSYRWGRAGFGLAVPQLQVAAGETVLLLGRSGSGKSRLLSLICGTVMPDQGRIDVGGADLCTLSAARRDRHRAEHIGLIFQQFNLLPYASVTDNILLPLRFAPTRRGRVSGPLHEAARLCAALGIDEALLAARAGSLSVGQQQRVAAARALIGFPQLIIADEPTSALDAASQETFLSLLFDQARTHNSAVMMVSHDARLAPMFDRVLQMDDIAQTLPPPPQKMRSATKPEHSA